MPKLTHGCLVLLAAANVSTSISARALPAGLASGGDEKALVKKAIRLIGKAGASRAKWDEAEAPLRKRLVELPASERASRATIHFNLAWILHRRAREFRLEREALLRASATHYAAVVKSYPKNAQAAINLALVYQEAQSFDDAIRVLKAAIAAGSKDRVKLKLALGDAYRRSKRPVEAWQAWIEIVREDWSQRAAHERLVQIYPELHKVDPKRFGKFYDYCKTLIDTRLAPLGARGMEELMRLARVDNSGVAEKALVAWAEQNAKQDTLESALRRIPSPASWKSAALRDLHTLVKGDPAKLDAASWWRSDPVRKHVASGVLSSRARSIESKEPRKAASFYSAAMNFAPKVSEYGGPRLKDKKAAQLQAAIPYTRLLHQQQADAELPKVEDLIRDLFNEKTAHYVRNDLPSMQQYHEALAVIRHDLKQ